MPPVVQCLLFVLLFAGLALLGHAAFRRFNDAGRHRENREVAAILFGTVSLLYSLVLAFAIVAVWEDYEEANTTVRQEAERLISAMGHLEMMPADLRDEGEQEISRYAAMVVRAEWQQPHPAVRTGLALYRFRQRLAVLSAQRPELTRPIEPIIEEMDEVFVLRAERIGHAHSHVPALVWVVLLGGAVLVLYFSWFLSATDGRLHLLWTALLAAMLAASLFLVYSLDRPFAPGGVRRDPMERVLLMARG